MIKKKVIKMCVTRFIERHESVIVAISLLPYVFEALCDMEGWSNYETRKSASNLINSIQAPKFLIGLVMLQKVSVIMKPVSARLQAVNNDLIAALADIDAVLRLLQDLRDWDTNEFAKMFEDILNLAEKIGVEREMMKVKPRIMTNSVYRANAGTNEQTAEDYYRINVFYPMIDSIMSDVKSRFGPHQKETFHLCKLLPHIVANSTWQDIYPAIKKYSRYLDIEVKVEGEFLLWRQKFISYQPAAEEKAPVINALRLCEPLIYPNISKLLKILAVLPVSTAEAERYFSKLEKTMTTLRTTMAEERLESLIMLNVHRARTPSIDAIIDKFAEKSSRRLNFII